MVPAAGNHLLTAVPPGWSVIDLKFHLKHVQDFAGGLNQSHNLAINGDENGTAWRWRQLDDDILRQRVTLLINLHWHDFALGEFPLPTGRELPATFNLLRQSRRQTALPPTLSLPFAAVTVISARPGIISEDSAFVGRNGDPHPRLGGTRRRPGWTLHHHHRRWRQRALRRRQPRLRWRPISGLTVRHTAR